MTKPVKKKSFQTIEQFFRTMSQENKVSESTLIELLGEKTARRVMDGADNEMGAPTLGSSTGVVLQGQLHAPLGGTAVDDRKANIADKLQPPSPQDSSNKIDRHQEPIAEKNLKSPKP